MRDIAANAAKPTEIDARLLLQQAIPLLESKELGSDWYNAFETIEFQLGDSLPSLPLLHNPNLPYNCEKVVRSEPYLYAICQGRVRLLSFCQEKQREVSTQVLSEGETVGGEALWVRGSLPYRAIAATPVQVTRISLDRLQPLLAKLPELEDKWRTEAKQQQALIFFKTLTDLRSLPSHRLQQLLPYFKEQELAPNATLDASSGRFWLREGQLQNSTLAPGSSWGYPADSKTPWVTQSKVRVYHLAKEDWESVCELVPKFAEIAGSPILGGDGGTGTLRDRTDAPRPTLKLLPSPPQREPAEAKFQREPKVIEFPKPLKHRPWLAQGYPFVEQQSATDCGAACLAMVSLYWGKRFSLNTLRNLAGVGRSGASLRNLAKAAETLGYNARPVRASLSRLVEQKNPWIAHWEGDHYVVVYRVKGDKILVADPGRGKRYLPRQEFLDGWTGYALLLDPTLQLQSTPSEKRSLLKFAGVLLPYRSIWVQVILLSLLIQLFGLVSPMFTQIILDRVVVNKSMTTLNVFALGVLLFGVWGLCLSSMRQYLLSYVSNRLDLTMIGGFIRHTLMLPLKFFELRQVGDILTRVQENQKIQSFLISQVVLAWLDFLMGFVYLGLMFYYNWQLTLLVLALIPPIAIVTLGATPLLRQVSRDIFNKSAEQNSALVETITGVATLKATASERELRWRWEDRFTKALNSRFRGQKLGIGLSATSGLINSVGSTALLWLGASLVIQDRLTIGQFVAFNMMIGRVLSPALSLANLWDELQEVLISVERLNDVFGTEPEETPDKPMLVLPRLRGDVRFENVTFRYESSEDRNTLQNLSFEVKAGQTIAVVGRSGSGKSTLVKLLQGLYYPTSGQIWIDDHEIQHISPQSLRSQMGVVPQDCFLFSGTILENITLYRSEFTLEQAIEMAKLAEAHAFIQSMPLGYNTKVGERGSTLSGGQRQRVAIARALLGDPRILVLDEATSSLDTESERRFQDNLARLSRDRTTFIIAHRLSTVRNADCILVLDRGVLVEQGTHEQLMVQQGLYYHLAQQQLDL